MTTATHPLVAVVRDRFGGVLSHGAHQPDGAACINEAVNAARGRPWSDDPGEWPDLRDLNDAPWSSATARTEHLLPVGVALWDWPDWSPERRAGFARRTAERTGREIVPMALRAAAAVHPDATHRAALETAAVRCADEGTAAVKSARAAARAAADAVSAARAAARAAADAVSAERAAADVAWAGARAAAGAWAGGAAEAAAWAAAQAAQAAARAAQAAEAAARAAEAAQAAAEEAAQAAQAAATARAAQAAAWSARSAQAAAWSARSAAMLAFVDVVEEACRDRRASDQRTLRASRRHARRLHRAPS